MTKLLFDENLPASLVRFIGSGSVHVTALGRRMSDAEIWQYAREHEFVILTKDADFFDRLILEGTPPKLIWVRVGNLRIKALEAEIARHWPAILSSLDVADLVTLHPDRIEAIRLKA